MGTVSIPCGNIEVRERHRPLSDDAVARLAASMREIGLRSPITIRVVNDYVLPDGEICDGVPILVAGHHRLAAAKSLGWSTIECVDADDDAISAELWEIAENLHRLDLTKEQRDEHLRRYADLREAKAAIQVHQSDAPEIGYCKPPPQTKGTARQIAEETGLSVATVRRALKPKPASKPELVEVVDAYDAVAKQADAIVRAWNRAGPDARALALEQIEGVVFDITRASS